MRLTLIALAVLWLLRNNDDVFVIWPDADILFTLIAVVFILPHLMLNLRRTAKALFLTSGSVFLHSVRMLLVVIIASAIAGQNPTRSLPYIGLAMVFIGFWLTMVEIRWRDSYHLEGDLRLIYLILSCLVFLSVLVNALELPSASLGPRFRGVSNNPNYLGLLSVLTLSLTPAMFRIVSKRSARIAVVASSLLALDALLASDSRGSMLALLFGYSAYLIIRLRLGKFIIPCGLAIATPLIVFPDYLQAVLSIFKRDYTDDEVSAGRFEIYGQVFDLISESWTWLYGVGFRAAEDLIEEGVAVHNIYLQVLLEMGIFGMLTFGALTIAVLLCCFQKNAVSVFLIPVVSILAFELTESSLFGFGNYLTQICWLLMGFAVAVGRLQRSSPTVFFVPRLRLTR